MERKRRERIKTHVSIRKRVVSKVIKKVVIQISFLLIVFLH